VKSWVFSESSVSDVTEPQPNIQVHDDIQDVVDDQEGDNESEGSVPAYYMPYIYLDTLL